MFHPFSGGGDFWWNCWQVSLRLSFLEGIAEAINYMMEPGVDLELRLGQPGQEVPLGRIEGEPNLPENEDRGRREAAREQRSLEREVTKLEQLHTRFREEADQFLQRNGIQVSDPEEKKKFQIFIPQV